METRQYQGLWGHLQLSKHSFQISGHILGERRPIMGVMPALRKPCMRSEQMDNLSGTCKELDIRICGCQQCELFTQLFTHN